MMSAAVKDLCWRQFTAAGTGQHYPPRLSKICAGVNSQRVRLGDHLPTGCQRSVLASIHSCGNRSPARCSAVKDLCWRQFTAVRDGSPSSLTLSKICAGVNSQRWAACPPVRACCQRSVLASIHSGHLDALLVDQAVKDLCWRQFTAGRPKRPWANLLSKICAGVNSQPSFTTSLPNPCCQRSVLASIHSPDVCFFAEHDAVKDLCWRQFTAPVIDGLHGHRLSKICAGVNSQQVALWSPWSMRCQRSVLASIHSSFLSRRNASTAVKDLCWRQFTAIGEL